MVVQTTTFCTGIVFCNNPILELTLFIGLPSLLVFLLIYISIIKETQTKQIKKEVEND